MILCTHKVHGQTDYSLKEAGRFFIDTYLPSDYDALPQNFSITQGQNGYMYFANSVGVLEFDGITWRTIPTDDRTRVRAIATGNDGKIYVGGVGEIGFLAPDSLGLLTYQSLLGELPGEEHTFREVWDIAQAHDGIYFLTVNRLIRYSTEGSMIWKSDSEFESISVLNDTLFVHENGKGLMKMSRDSLVLIPGGDFFAEKNVQQLIPGEGSSYYAVTSQHGLFTCDITSSCQPFNTDTEVIEKRLKNHNS